MKTRNSASVRWSVLGMALWATPAWADRYPLDQLIASLENTRIKLAATEVTISDLELEMKATNKNAASLATAVRLNRTASAVPDAELRSTRDQMTSLRRRLVMAYGARTALINEIEGIRDQIAYWRDVYSDGPGR